MRNMKKNVNSVFFATKSVIFGLTLLLSSNLKLASTFNLFLYLFLYIPERMLFHAGTCMYGFSASSDISF